jgi:biopolymer transport protein ExbD
MGLKKNNKVSAEFSMSSLTDIIFLLLIFFMLTSSIVAPNAVNLKLPGKKRVSQTSNPKTLDEIAIRSDGTYRFNGKKVSLNQLNSRVRSRSRSSKKVYMKLLPSPNAPTQQVVQAMDLGRKYDVELVLTLGRS